MPYPWSQFVVRAPADSGWLDTLASLAHGALSGARAADLTASLPRAVTGALNLGCSSGSEWALVRGQSRPGLESEPPWATAFLPKAPAALSLGVPRV